MNRFKYSIAAALLVVFTGCDLLDVSPRGEQNEKEMFKTEDGYKQALTGVYIRIASADLYGANTSFYLPEVLAQTWQTPHATHTVDTDLRKWDFSTKEAEDKINRIFNSYYLAIAEINNILGHIDGSKDVFRNGNYDLIKGEALGLRAFLHLDLLRLFGPIPGAQAAGKITIPYAEVFSKNPADYISLSYEAVTSKILRDLNTAEELLAADPFIGATVEQMEKPGEWEDAPNDSWQYYRQVRFNYYAVLAAKARFYHWTGDKGNAVKYAEEVVKTGKFKFVMSDGFNKAGALAFGQEQIFAVHNSKHQSVIEPYFVSGDLRLTQTEAAITLAYEGNSDTRNVAGRFWEERNNPQYGLKNHFLKYTGSGTAATKNRIPLMRIPEMYFILVQNLPVGDERIAQYFKEYTDARNLPQSWSEELTEEALIRTRMEMEHRKEFMGEGQMFFFYKKYGYGIYTWPEQFTVPAAHADYVIPKPKGQIVFE